MELHHALIAQALACLVSGIIVGLWGDYNGKSWNLFRNVALGLVILAGVLFSAGIWVQVL